MANLQEMKQNNGSAVTAAANHPILSKTTYLEKRKDLLGAGMPSHMTVEREIRTATVMLMQSKDLQASTPDSFYMALSIAVNSGIGLGNGKGYLVAYKGKCSYVPGWKGLVDLVSRTGRGTVWTGVVHNGDHFEYALGDSPFLNHRPGDNESHKDITHYYAIGRVKGSEWPHIVVWSVKKVISHLNKYNKVGGSHYALKDDNNMEMYGRKVTLMQVLKYMPQSQDLENAITADTAAEANKSMTIDGDFMYINEDEEKVPDQPAAKEKPVTRTAQRSEPVDAQVTDVQEKESAPQASDADAAFNRFSERLAKANDLDMLDADADLIRDFSEADQADLKAIYATRRDQLESRNTATATPAARAPARSRPAMNLE